MTTVFLDQLSLRCAEKKFGNKRVECNATNYSEERGSVATIVDQYENVLERIAVNASQIVFRASQLQYHINYTIKFGTGEQMIRLEGMCS